MYASNLKFEIISNVPQAVPPQDAKVSLTTYVNPAGVRRLRSEDVPALCELFAETFRPGREIRMDALARCLEETYLSAPGDREMPASLVDVAADGRVLGFMGIITVNARFGNERLRGGIVGNFMAQDINRAKIGLRLARASTMHDLDFLFTDTASTKTVGIARAMGFKIIPLQSLEWMKILSPCQTVSALLRDRIGMLGSLLVPFARGVDVLARRLSFAKVSDQARHQVIDAAIDPDAFAARAPALVARFRFRPDWMREELTWLLDQAGRKTIDGTLHVREVTNRDGVTLGLYLLYAKRGGVAHALQILSARRSEEVVLTALLQHARAIGAVAVRGAASPQIVEGLMRHSGVIYRHVTSSTVFTRRPDLNDALASNAVMLGGLLGESWTRLVADDFA